MFQVGSTCPLCDTETTGQGEARTCPQCGLRGSLSVLTAIARLRVQADRRSRSSRDAYGDRNRCIAALAWLALRHGYRAGVGRHAPDPDPTWDPQWRTVIYVELPTGQVSWHVPDHDAPLFEGLPAYEPAWDGHQTLEKRTRLSALKL